MAQILKFPRMVPEIIRLAENTVIVMLNDKPETKANAAKLVQQWEENHAKL